MPACTRRFLLVGVLLLPATALPTPGAHVVVTVDGTVTPAPISPWIFGLNNAASTETWGHHPTRRYVTVNRMGGNRFSEYSWESNWSNAGADFAYHNDQFLSSSSAPGAAVRGFADPIFGRKGTLGNALLLTVPLIGYVSAPWPTCDQSQLFSAGPRSCNAPIPPALSADQPAPPTIGVSDRPSFHRYLPHRPGDPGHAHATAHPDVDDDVEYEDDFLSWLQATYPRHAGSTREPIFIGMDGEPDGWGHIHPEVRGLVNPGPPDEKGSYAFRREQEVKLPFEDLIARTVAAAGTVKDLLGPRAMVFGPVMASWAGFINLDHTRPPPGYDYFLEYYLDRLREAARAQNRRLLDVLDIHLYPEATNGGAWHIGNEYAPQGVDVILTREQAPRTFWDPNYFERSWITDYGVIPPCGFGCAPQMIRRVKRMITARYPPFSRADEEPGTRLGVSEYALYRSGDMSGAIAQADLLGIFAREGVYEATAWPNSNRWAPGYGDVERAYKCLWAAFSAYLNFDGNGGHFGDGYVPAAVSDTDRPVDWVVSGARRGNGSRYPKQLIERVTAYASVDRNGPARLVIIAINKDLNRDSTLPAPLTVEFRVKHRVGFRRAEIYRVAPGTPFSASGGAMAQWPPAATDCAGPVRLKDLQLSGQGQFALALPAQSITVIVMKP